jgi:hypothetical protein
LEVTLIYDYKCISCQVVHEEDHLVDGFKEFHPKCPDCGGICNYIFTPTIVQFSLIDGPSGSWPSKGEHFKNYRNEQNEKAKRRQKDRYGHLNRDAIPNYLGRETSSWREAQSEAKKDRGEASARTYESKIKQSKKKIS